MRRLQIELATAATLLLALTACGGNDKGVAPPPPPVVERLNAQFRLDSIGGAAFPLVYDAGSGVTRWVLGGDVVFAGDSARLGLVVQDCPTGSLCADPTNMVTGYAYTRHGSTLALTPTASGSLSRADSSLAITAAFPATASALSGSQRFSFVLPSRNAWSIGRYAGVVFNGTDNVSIDLRNVWRGMTHTPHDIGGDAVIDVQPACCPGRYYPNGWVQGYALRDSVVLHISSGAGGWDGMFYGRLDTLAGRLKGRVYQNGATAGGDTVTLTKQ